MTNENRTYIALAVLVLLAGFTAWLLRQKLAALADRMTTPDNKLLWPVPGYRTVTSNYGMRVHPVTGERKLHNGIDIGAPTGADVVASIAGTVALSSSAAGGLQITITGDNPSPVKVGYAHLSARSVTNGQRVKRGDIIGKVGATGQVTGPHLHFTVTDPFGEKLDPKPLLA